MDMAYLKSIMFNYFQIMCKFFRFIMILLMIALISLANGCSNHHLQFKNSDANLHDICWQKISQFNAQQDALNYDLDQQIYQYQEVIEELLVNREKSVSLIENIDKTNPIPSADLDALNMRLQSAMDIVDRVVSVIDRNQCWQEANDGHMQALGLLPLDPAVQLKGSMLALSAGLMLYDSYQAVVAVVNEDDRIRRFLNQSDIGYGIREDQLAAITDDFLSISNLSTIQNSIAFYEQRRTALPLDAVNDENFSYLDLLIQGTRSYKILRELSIDNKVARRFGKHTDSISDSLNALNRSAVNGVSELFGNAVGAVEERKGRMYQDKIAESLILSQLQAGDILLEKTPFRLTDRMIPGYWGHAAIWVGNQQELISLGIWNTPLVNKYHQQIQNQQRVVEALRDGTKMNTLGHFLNIDDLVVLRKKNLTDQHKKKIIELTLRQVGKPYDFNYDVETTDKIVCSQLVYLAYTGIDWPTDSLVGRYTISPDNIAQKVLYGGELEIIFLYRDGKQVKGDVTAVMSTLLDK